MSGKPSGDKLSPVERVIASLLRRHGRELEVEYRANRAQQAEQLYNSLVVTISTIRPSIETLLYVLEMLKAEAIQEKRGQLMPGQTATVKQMTPKAVAGEAKTSD